MRAIKKISFVVLLGMTSLLLNAQSNADSWKITWNNKLLLATNKSDERSNSRKVKLADLKKKYMLVISYKESDVKKEMEWIRSFMIFDESDNEIARKDAVKTCKLTAAELKEMLGDKKKLKIYTISLPKDPNLAARVRVRRVHLCTLEFQ